MLKTRLDTCLGYLSPHKVLYDVGTDHAYLPIAACKQGLIEKAYAVDNKKGPLNQAQSNIESYDLSASIQTVLSNGLNALTDDVDVVVIAGMGGSTIYSIMHNADYKAVKRFVLQPNVHPHLVRKLCQTDALKIVDEVVVDEDGNYYPILVFERGEMALSENELALGPILLKTRSESFLAMLKNEADYLQALIENIPTEDAKAPHQKRLKMITEVLYERNRH